MVPDVSEVTQLLSRKVVEEKVGDDERIIGPSRKGEGVMLVPGGGRGPISGRQAEVECIEVVAGGEQAIAGPDLECAVGGVFALQSG